MPLIDNIPEHDGAAVYALIDRNGNMYIGSSTNCHRRITTHLHNMAEVEKGGCKMYNEALTRYIKSGGTFTASILEVVENLDDLETAEQRHYEANKALAIYNVREPYRSKKSDAEKKKSEQTEKLEKAEKSKSGMTITEYAQDIRVSTQAIYKKLTLRGIPLDSIREKATGLITEGGIDVLNQLFAEKAQTKASEVDGRSSKKEREKDQAQINQLKKQLSSLQDDNDRLTKEVDSLRRQISDLTSDRDYLRLALNQAQQLHAMTLNRLLPPAPAERKGAFSWLTSRFKKPAPAADQIQTEQTGNNQ